MSANEELPDNHPLAERRHKLERLRERGTAYPNDFRRDATAEELHLAYGDRPPEWLGGPPPPGTVARAGMLSRGVAGGPPDGGQGRRADDVQAAHGEGELRQAQGPLGSDPALPAAGRAWRRLRGLQGLRRR